MHKLLHIFIFIFGLFHCYTAQNVYMYPNKGQWDNPILYRVELSNGNMYITPNNFTYHFTNLKELHSHKHDQHDDKNHNDTKILQEHIIKSTFVGSDFKGETVKLDSSEHYQNYFLGNDKTKWKSNIYGYNGLLLKNYYPSIDLKLEGLQETLKYSFIVKKAQDVHKIKIKIEGAERIYIDKKGDLHIKHRFGEIIEKAPLSWYTENKNDVIETHFKIDGDLISFEFSEALETGKSITIDPSLTFSTFTGSTLDNWGMTAAPDPSGNLFGGGIAFGGTGVYPLTAGAYDNTYNGGHTDIAITKFNANGNALLYSTYIGGNNAETPHSIISNSTGDIWVMGVTSSSDFPMPGSPYDNTFNGGNNQSIDGIQFTSGTDIIVFALNAAGNNLNASTYIGGSNDDGLNLGTLQYNYGDALRGEIILDASNNVYITSCTRSSDFPIVLGTQGSMNGLSDAIICKLNPNLSNLFWSTFYGGSGLETGNSVQINSAGNVFVTGGTNSSNLQMFGGFDVTYNSGLSDAYLSCFNPVNGQFLFGTFIGAGEYDQGFFVQFDLSDNVYVFGQSETDLGISTGKYGTINSGQFIQKFSPNLSLNLWKTMVGAPTGHVNISPTAFLVSNCGDIYFAGWGGQLNQQYGQASFSTTTGFTVTSDAYQALTNGSNFYIAVLGPDANNLKYATFMGGNSSSYNHVDGGTSRFDKAGRVYHAVCGACGGNDNGFTTTPGVWSPTNQSSNCNLAAFKFELSTIDAIISNPAPLICLPNPVIFNNNSVNGNTYFWNFGDGTTSTNPNPSHVYASAGAYNVTLIVSDNQGCFTSDTSTVTVNIGDFQGGVVIPPNPVCPNTPYQLDAYGGKNYSWTPSNVLNNPNIANPIATITQNTVFTVIISDSCGTDTLQVPLNIFNPNLNISNDTSICIGNSVQLNAGGAVTYQWSPTTFLSNPNINNPIATPTSTTKYYLNATTSDGCNLIDSVLITVYFTPPNPVIPDTAIMCQGASVSISVSGAESYSWSPNNFISNTVSQNVTVFPPSEMYYYCDFTNACGTERDSVYIKIRIPSVLAGNDTIICPGQSAMLWSSGALTYSWTPSAGLNLTNQNTVIATPSVSTIYTVTGTDIYGCTASANVTVNLFPKPIVQANADIYTVTNEDNQLFATSNTVGNFEWSPPEFLSCVTCNNPIASNVSSNITYTVTFTDTNGCKATDNVKIIFEPFIFIPNTFTPNKDEFNANFFVVGVNIKSIQLDIYNRWGELIHSLYHLDESWDGTYKGIPCQDGTYTWKLTYIDINDHKETLTGHINLLR